MCPSWSQNAEGMEPDDLLWSRNARSRTPLVGRAQWTINQPPSLKRERASAERFLHSITAWSTAASGANSTICHGKTHPLALCECKI